MRRLFLALVVLLAPAWAMAQNQLPSIEGPGGYQTAAPTVQIGYTAAGVAQSSFAPIASSSSGALQSNRVLKASAGNLASLTVTTDGTAGHVMVFDATSAPADGAVTPKICRHVAANSTVVLTFNYPAAFATGITAVFSSTGCFTKTASATAFFEGYVQ